jgi:AcrR family transcriptional regulator
VIGKVAQRREAKVASIVSAAWELARTHGIGGLSLHALAREVGMRQPSLYAYFDSKLALYDAMFADGNRQLIERVDALRPSSDPRRALKTYMRAFVDFATEVPARQALLFQRVIPGFEPSEESYAIAQAVMARSVAVMNATGIVDQADIDCLIAMIGGLVERQQANDPGGTRWIRHVDRMIDMFLDDIKRRRRHR